MRFVRAFVVATAASCVACASIPNLEFVPNDAEPGGSTDATIVVNDGGGSVLPSDGSGPDGSVADVVLLDQGAPPREDSGQDSGIDATPTCTPGPSGVTLCCGPIPCFGSDAKKCGSACPNCEATCNVGQTCCLDKSGAIAACTSVACP